MTRAWCANCGACAAQSIETYDGGPCRHCGECPVCGGEWDTTLDMCADEAADEQPDPAHDVDSGESLDCYGAS